MSSSTSNMPTVIVAIVIAIILIGFYVADRSSGGSPDVSSITHNAGTDKMIAQKAKYEREKSVFNHAGFSGSVEDYLQQSEEGFNNSANSQVVKEHTGYSGSGDEYVERFEEITDKELKNNAAEHTAYSGSIDDYLAGNYDKKQKDYSPKHPRDGATQDGGDSDQGYSGSMGEYMKKFGG